MDAYANLYGDISEPGEQSRLTRDPPFAREFVLRRARSAVVWQRLSDAQSADSAVRDPGGDEPARRRSIQDSSRQRDSDLAARWHKSAHRRRPAHSPQFVYPSMPRHSALERQGPFRYKTRLSCEPEVDFPSISLGVVRLCAGHPCGRVLLLLLLAASPEATEFPYVAYISSDDVYIRSGPGKNYYPTAKMKRGEPVEVFRHDPGGWYAIRPPVQSFSWISARQLDVLDDGLAAVNTDRAVARVGSLFSEVRDVIQVRLNKNERVELVDTHASSDDKWYKITPPAGEFRWIYKDYVTGRREGRTGRRRAGRRGSRRAAAPSQEQAATGRR